jgi:tetratricopeptide (TPR) repeat protein
MMRLPFMTISNRDAAEFESCFEHGREAIARGEYVEAVSLLERACESALDDPSADLARLHLASIEILQGRRGDLNVFRENLLKRHSPRHLLTASYYLVIASVDAQDREAAERYLPTLLESAVEMGDAGHLIRAYDAAAGVQSLTGKHGAALQCGLLALGALVDYDGDDREALRGSILHNLAYNALAANLHDDAVRFITESIPLVEQFGTANELRQGLVTAAFAYLCKDRHDEALAFADRAQLIVRDTRLERYVHYVRGEVARRRGDVVDARRHFRELEAIYPEVPELSEILLSFNLAPFLLPE